MKLETKFSCSPRLPDIPFCLLLFLHQMPLGTLFYTDRTATSIAHAHKPSLAGSAAAPHKSPEFGIESNTGTASMTKKRKSSNDDRTGLGRLSTLEAANTAANAIETEGLREENKKQRTAIDRVAKEFVCPISMVLPIDPVIAEVSFV